MYEDNLPEYEGKRRVYVNLTQRKGEEVVCGLHLEDTFQAAIDLLMPAAYGGLNLQPHDEVMAKIKAKQELLKAMAVGDRLQGVCDIIECRELDCDEYACLDLEVLENGF